LSRNNIKEIDMTRLLARTLLGGAVALALTGAGAGMANADPAPAPGDTAIWLVPGLDGGGLLGPSIPAPTEVLAPIFGVLP
jgi:hypothetical protein